MTIYSPNQGAPGAPQPSYPPPPPPVGPPQHRKRQRWPWIVGAALLVVAVVVTVAAGTSGDGDDTATTDRPESTVTPPGSNPETSADRERTTTTEPASGVPQPAVEYFEALASADLSRMGAMLDSSVRESPAAHYATHQIANLRSLGQAPIGTTAEVGDETIVLRTTSYDEVGNEVAENITYGDFEVERDHLVSFALDDVGIAERIRSGDPAGVSGDGVSVRVVTAYVTARGDLALNLDVTNTRDGVIELSDYDWTLITPDGRQVAKSEVVCCPIAPSIQPGATAGHVVYYEQVGLGGTLQFVAFADDFVTEIRFDVPLPS